MNQVFNLSRWSSLMARQLYLSLDAGSLKVAVAAITCASLVYAEPLNYADLGEFLFSCLVNEPLSVTEYLTK